MRFPNGIYHEPGIYFGMPESEYHSDYALGSTDLRNLLISPIQFYHHSRANPFRDEDKDTPARLRGRAIHKCVLEGRDAFDKLYFPKPPKPTEGQLVTVEHLKAKAKELGIAVSGRKDDLIARIVEMDPATPIYDIECAKHVALAGDRTMLDEDLYANILVASQNIGRSPQMQDAFSGGYPEVSVFWTQQGIPMRARFDYLKPKAVVDLKSTRNHFGQIWSVAVPSFLARSRAEIQATHYLNARSVMRKMVKEGKVFGTHDPKWLKNVVEQDEYVFVFVIYQDEGAPLTQGVIFRKDDDDYEVAQMSIDQAIASYKYGFDKFGSDIWVEEPKLEYWSSLDFPMWRGT